MIVTDTNVVSAMMRLAQEPAVLSWLDAQDVGQLFIPTPAIFEIQFGIAKFPPGRRRRRLQADFDAVLASVFNGRVLDFDARAAVAAGEARAAQIAQGIVCEVPDSQIAGVALSHRAAIATRDRTGFSGLRLQLIDPWSLTI